VNIIMASRHIPFPIYITFLLVPLAILFLSTNIRLSSNVIVSTPDDYPVHSAAVRQTEVSMPYMRKLANDDTFIDALDELYHKYGAEIAEYRPVMRKWCEVTDSCKFGDYEAEMLYMLVREHKPQNVFEMAPNRGYSSHWILKALHLNDDTSRLHSFDIHESSVPHMDEKYKARWVFTLGDYSKLYDDGELDMNKFDFLFVDALHEPEFARGYCKRLFATHKRKNTVVAIHDIVANALGGGRESEEVYKYLAMAGNAQNVFTMARFAMPNNLYKPQTADVLPIMNQIRVDMGIVKPCGDASGCARHDHDFLYFENNDAPTIFFTLN
jgi:predicted O-methyltransferase YrrM